MSDEITVTTTTTVVDVTTTSTGVHVDVATPTIAVTITPSLPVAVDVTTTSTPVHVDVATPTVTVTTTPGLTTATTDALYEPLLDNPDIDDYVLSSTAAGVRSWVAQSGGVGGAPTTATYITQTPSASLSAEQALSALGTGLLKNTTGTGVLSIASASDIPTITQSQVANLVSDLAAKASAASVTALDADIDAEASTRTSADTALNDALLLRLLTSDFTWTNLSDKPSTFAPSTHASTHQGAGSDPLTLSEDQITNLTTDLAGKVPTGRTLTINGDTFDLSADRSWTVSGGGSPGGSDTQIQFNDADTFGGDAGLTYDKTTKAVTLTGPELIALISDVVALTLKASAGQTANALEVLNSDGARLAFIDTRGRVGIGDRAVTEESTVFIDDYIDQVGVHTLLDVHETLHTFDRYGETSGIRSKIFIDDTSDLGSDPRGYFYGINAYVNMYTATTGPGNIVGTRSLLEYGSPTIRANSLIGQENRLRLTSSGGADYIAAMQCSVQQLNSTIFDTYNVRVIDISEAWVSDPTSLNQWIGLHIGNQDQGVAPYAIYTNAGLVSLGDDVEFRNNGDGVILIDQDDGVTRWRLKVNSGVVSAELV